MKVTSCSNFVDTWQYFGGKLACIVISGFRRDVDEICALLGCYAALSDSSVPTFRDNISVKDYHSTLRNIPEERRSCLSCSLKIYRSKHFIHPPNYRASCPRTPQCSVPLQNEKSTDLKSRALLSGNYSRRIKWERHLAL